MKTKRHEDRPSFGKETVIKPTACHAHIYNKIVYEMKKNVNIKK